MYKPKIFVSRIIAQEALDLLASETEMEVWQDELPPSREVLLEKAFDSDGIITLLTDRIDADFMDSVAGLRVISNMAVGYDNIDVSAATERGILVGNTPDVLTETTADFIFALLMAAARRVVEADRFTRQGKWTTWGPLVLQGQDVHHATLGIIGMGRIGTEVAKRARGFDMNVLYFSRSRKSPEEESRLGIEYVPEISILMEKSDFVSVHVPLNDDTHHMIGAEQFALMKPSAVFVNTSRGAVVDQSALYHALKGGRIFSAALDVTETEPVAPDDPLLSLDNVIIAPHIGSSSYPTRTRMALMAAENLLAGLRGDLPPNCVNPEAVQE